MTEYMKANITRNYFWAGDGRYIKTEKGAIAFRDVDHLKQIIDEQEAHIAATTNKVCEITVDSIEAL